VKHLDGWNTMVNGLVCLDGMSDLGLDGLNDSGPDGLHDLGLDAVGIRSSWKFPTRLKTTSLS
jgi:hypothetical protein